MLLIGALQGLSLQEILAYLLALGLTLLIGMTIHEFAHNYVGHLMGDPVPARQGRLTLNPLVHINPVGWLMFLLIGFGFLGSAPIAAHRMRNPRWGYLAAVAAGPLSNLLLAIVVGIFLRIVGGSLDLPPNLIGLFLGRFLFFMVYFNVILFLFNLLPLFPIDGWWIVYALLPPDLAYTWERYREYSMYAFYFLLLLSFLPGSFNLFSLLIGQPALSITRLIIG